MIKLLISVVRKNNYYKLILIVTNQLTKIVYYKLIKTNLTKTVKVILNMIMQYYGMSNPSVIDGNSFFILISGYYSVIFLALNKNFQSHFPFRQIVKLNYKIA